MYMRMALLFFTGFYTGVMATCIIVVAKNDKEE